MAAQGAQPPTAHLVWIHAQDGEAPAPRVKDAATRYPGCKVVVLAAIPRDDDALAALGAGAHGYCNAYADPQVLREIAEVVLRGGLWVGESLLSRLIAALAPASRGMPVEGAEDPLLRLTAREREIADHVLKGRSNKEISRETGLAERTVKAHLTAIFEKAGVRDRLQFALVCSRSKAAR